MMVNLELASHRANNPAYNYNWVAVCILSHGRRVDNVDQVINLNFNLVKPIFKQLNHNLNQLDQINQLNQLNLNRNLNLNLMQQNLTFNLMKLTLNLN